MSRAKLFAHMTMSDMCFFRRFFDASQLRNVRHMQVRVSVPAHDDHYKTQDTHFIIVLKDMAMSTYSSPCQCRPEWSALLPLHT